ncbi:MAG: thiamine pyrophosphate-dependent dehydrogenase E1 component subunit alpha [Anaerolineales bacterium]|nr:thiamine pyrophosphate-dependent dehydrogenase E1 component subunit alpha [Anaerolineales bacterium]
MSELSQDLLLDMYRQMVRIRTFEDTLYQLFLQGLVPGTLHQYQGQEAVAVGVCSALHRADLIFSTHRPVGHGIAKGMSLDSIAAELWGKAAGCVGGKGGQMHLSDVAVGMMPSSAIVGGNIPIAVGAALGFRLSGQERVSVSFFGDGASNIGAFHEGLNLAAVKGAPVVFVCENNQYAASTHTSLTMKIKNIADRASSYGMPGMVVDGMDVSAVYAVAREAVARARRGDGPTLLECKTFRYMGHSRGDPGQYRSPEELAAWKARDPIIQHRERLAGLVEKSVIDAIDRESREEAQAAVEFAMAAPEPDPAETYTAVYAEREVR